MIMKILHRKTGTVLFENSAATIKQSLANAVASGANLSGANLSGANLIGADLSEANQLKAELVAHQASQAVQELVRAPLPEPVKARGSATRRELRYVVVDIAALYKARPELCTVDVRPSAIKAVCNPPVTADRVNPDKSIPGLSVYWELCTAFRA